MIGKVVQQDPAEMQPYRVTVNGDTISSADWTSIPPGLNISVPQNVSGTSSSTSDVFVSGVTTGTRYELRVDILTGGGGEFVRSLIILGVSK